MSRPAPRNFPQTGPGLYYSVAGVMRDEVTPQEEGGQDAQRRREPSNNREQIGERQTLQNDGLNHRASTLNSRETRREASTSIQNSRMWGPDMEPEHTHPITRPRNTPRETLHQPRRRKQSLKVASLNINGNGSRSDDKWGAINNVMKTRGIAVMAAQETHPTMEVQEKLERRFRNSLRFFHSSAPEEPGNRNGVTIILNKRLIKSANVSTKTIIEGRAIIVDVPWNSEDVLRIMGVYAPVKNNEKTAFWEELNQKMLGLDGPTPDLVVGDFNIVENPEIDRLMNRGNTDPTSARNALSSFTMDLNLADGWRRRHPNKRKYTYIGQSRSRLDRIYIKEELYPWCTDWAIEHPAVRTDHHLVSVRITSEDMPYIGKGRWAIPIGLLRNKQLKRRTQQLAQELRDDIEESIRVGRETKNPQLALKTFKNKVVDAYRNYQKTVQPRIISALKTLQKGLDEVESSTNLTEEEITTEAGLINERMDALERKRRDEAYLVGTARNWLEGETLSKHWVRSAKENTPRDTIRALRNPLGGADRRVTRSDKMAGMAKEYHEALLSVDRDPLSGVNQMEFKNVTKNLETALDGEMQDNMHKQVSGEEVEMAMKDSANEKSPGLDGIPTEVWKLLHQQYKSAKDDERHKFCNITEVLAYVFNDIAENGITEGTDFNEGWMCPIYKKKEADNVANYRPITLLNTDYKIFTKVIATRLSVVAPHLIHPDQAGFIRGRSIFDQIEQTNMTINYAKLKGMNGIIVALDQEKAYDKLTHPYLWKILEKLAFPEETVNMIKALYRNAKTSVVINGVISEPFIVTRGVRQGDPMSCILFNLGIEPLAANIRRSNVKGIEIPNLNESVKVSLFADDTTVILAENDSFGELTALLQRWCSVSGAKFNVEKTEIIPIGSAEYRKSVRETRKINENESPIPETIHIAADKEATRILGAWIGNDTNPEEPWRPIVETIKKDFARWATRYPTLEGKRHIVQMIAGGKTQFLTQAQGMPDKIRDEIQKLINEFVWEKTVSSMKIEDLSLEFGGGGRKVMDIKTRNEAIDLMWIKDYLRMGKDRPKWAFLADEIFRVERPKRAKETFEEIAKWNPFTQNWHPKTNAKSIPVRVQKAMKLAEKHGVRLEASRPDQETRGELPIWLHWKTSSEAARLYKKDEAKCLKVKHKTHYVRQMLDLITGVPENHRRTNFCACEMCGRMSGLGCTHPHSCLEMARKLVDAITLTWRPSALEGETPGQRTQTSTVGITLGEHEMIAGGQTLMTDLENSIRIFTDRADRVDSWDWDESNPSQDSETVVYTDGSCINNGTAEAKAGSGIWFGYEDPRNTAVRVPGEEQSNQSGELLAILLAVKKAPWNIPLRIRSDSKFAIDGLTKHVQKWEGKDWIGIKHGKLFKCTTAWIRARPSVTTLQWVKGHASIVGNEEADRLAAEGARKDPQEPDIDLRMPGDTTTTGMKLTKASQSLIYHHLKGKRALARQATSRSLEAVKAEVKDLFGLTPTTEATWRSMRH